MCELLHIKDEQFRFKGPTSIYKIMGIECKRIGLGYAADALADYKIGSVDPESDRIIGHKLIH